MSQKGFLDIPEKVRQRVYELLYLHVEPLAPLHNKVDRRHHTVTFEGVALLRTCRQIHTEGSAVAYGANEWDFHPRGLIVLRDFLKCIGPRNRACLKRIAINLECWNKIQQEPPANEKSRLFPSATGIFCLLQGRPLHYLKLENFASDEICPPNSRTPWSGFYKALQKIETDVLHVHGPNSLDFHAFLAGEMAASSVVAEITNDGRWHLGKESRRNQVQWPDWNTVVHRMEASLTKPKDLFSGLPPEIRNGIYRLLFEQRNDVYPLSGPHNSESKSSTPPERTLLCPGIGMLRASKLISMESCSIVYGNNVYNVMARKTTDIADWLETIGSRNRTSIKRLYLDWDHHIRGLDGAFLAQWTISSPHHPMIQQLVKPMETKVNLMNEALNGLWEDVDRELMASLLKCLDLLRDSYGITHLTVVIPMLYGIFWEADHICVAVEPPEQETTVEICNAIKMLRVSQKLRIGNMYEFDLAEPVGRAVDAAEIAIFDPDDDICDSGLDWPEQWINDEDLHELRLELALRGGTRAMADFMTRWLGRQVQAPTVTTLV